MVLYSQFHAFPPPHEKLSLRNQLQFCRSLVMGRTMFEDQSRVFKFDYQNMNMFESVRC